MQRLLLAALLMACCSGCATITTWTAKYNTLYVYSGTRSNIGPFEEMPRDGDYVGLRRYVSILDFPCSLALDTAALPVTIPLELFAEKPTPARRKEEE